jgi:rare lipoprotein A
MGLLACSVMALGGCSIVAQGLGDYDSGVKGRGTASWYGQDFHGRLTASGEVFDQYKLTAAHRTLPLGAHVRVLNVANGRDVDVLINDRGPFIEGRIIDLSYAAAEQLDMIHSGTIPVVVELSNDPVLSAESDSGDADYLASTLDEFTTIALSARWTGSRDVWIAPTLPRQSAMSWYPLGDLRDERRSRRLAQFNEENPHLLPLSGWPLPDEFSGSMDWLTPGISV